MFDRLRKYGVLNILLAWDLLLPVVVSSLLFIFYPELISTSSAADFVSFGRNVSVALIGVTLSSAIILVSLSNESFLNFLQKNDSYAKLFFLFEYNIAIAILATISGMTIVAVGVSNSSFYLFLALFGHLLLSILRLISGVVTFGEKKGEYESIKNLDGEKMRQESDLPDRILKEEYQSSPENEEDIEKETN